MRLSETTDRLIGGFHFEMLPIFYFVLYLLKRDRSRQAAQYPRYQRLFMSGFQSCSQSRPDFFTSKADYTRYPANSRARERKKTLILRISNFAILIMLVIVPNTYECFEYDMSRVFMSFLLSHELIGAIRVN